MRPRTVDPTYVIDGVVHYCVANMPGAVPITSTYVLNNAILSGPLAIANQGWKKALSNDKHLLNGLNICQGKVTYKTVADDLGYKYTETNTLLMSS
ncbi:hypothetical protein [Abyssogena phaseoliformis symbiont]|uniref:hypothetical protein n=1 Tax=Abyssogena phaseoliformis symbiont TaxID=596095 RepID=UPI0024783D3D|nr:hypothetical protein [Abyssogena phaseoliformis symbiont]